MGEMAKILAEAIYAKERVKLVRQRIEKLDDKQFDDLLDALGFNFRKHVTETITYMRMDKVEDALNVLES